MVDIQVPEMPVEAGLELGGEPPPHLVNELDRRRLVAAVIDLEHPDLQNNHLRLATGNSSGSSSVRKSRQYGLDKQVYMG